MARMFYQAHSILTESDFFTGLLIYYQKFMYLMMKLSSEYNIVIDDDIVGQPLS